MGASRPSLSDASCVFDKESPWTFQAGKDSRAMQSLLCEVAHRTPEAGSHRTEASLEPSKPQAREFGFTPKIQRGTADRE